MGGSLSKAPDPPAAAIVTTMEDDARHEPTEELTDGVLRRAASCREAVRVQLDEAHVPVGGALDAVRGGGEDEDEQEDEQRAQVAEVHEDVGVRVDEMLRGLD